MTPGLFDLVLTICSLTFFVTYFVQNFNLLGLHSVFNEYMIDIFVDILLCCGVCGCDFQWQKIIMSALY